LLPERELLRGMKNNARLAVTSEWGTEIGGAVMKNQCRPGKGKYKKRDKEIEWSTGNASKRFLGKKAHRWGFPRKKVDGKMEKVQ